MFDPIFRTILSYCTFGLASTYCLLVLFKFGLFFYEFRNRDNATIDFGFINYLMEVLGRVTWIVFVVYEGICLS